MPKENYEINLLEDKFSSLYNRKYCIMTGRATTAIYIALRASKIKLGQVLMPSILCASPGYAVLYCGLKPVFCDVNIEDYNINIDSINEVMTNEIKVIIPVHLFGQPADMNKILEIAEDNNLFIIEDAAQAIGGTYKNKKLGSFGDISVFSFGFNKIIDVGGGGALLTDDKKIAISAREELKKLGPPPALLDKKRDEYFRTYNELKNKIMSGDISAYDSFYKLPYLYKEWYLNQIKRKWVKAIDIALDELSEQNRKRNIAVEEYKKNLSHKKIIHPKYNEGDGVFWRYSILLKNNLQKKIIDATRTEGIWIGELYKPIHRMFLKPGEYSENQFKNAELIGNDIINLMTDPTVTQREPISKTIDIILETLSKN